MSRRGSLPWLFLAGILSLVVAVFLDTALFSPFADAMMGLDGWRGSDLQYANEGQRMIGDFVDNLLAIVAFAITIGVIIEARRAI